MPEPLPSSRPTAVRGLLGLLILLAGATPPAVAEPPPAATEQIRPADRFSGFFAPFRTEIATLSPDGRMLAYSLREADVVHVVVIEVDQPTVARAKVAVVSDKQATPALAIGSGERVPGRIQWMRWITPTRLVLETNRVFVSGQTSIAGEIVAIDADGRNARSLADAGRLSRQVGSGFRAPRLIGFDPAAPESVLVVGEASESVGRYSVHTGTGKLKHLAEEFLDPRMVMLLDRSGRPRIGIEYNTSKRFPLPFLLDTRKFGRPWKPLDELAAGEPVAGFVMHPANYFGERSVPLGFDAAGRLLYYASNSGRDTFGIYALDLETGKKAPTTIENPAIDLWEPVPGVFPDLRVAWTSDAPAGEDVDLSAAETSDEGETGDGEEEQSAEATEVPGVSDLAEARTQSRATGLITPARNTDDRVLVYDRFTDKVAGIRLRGSRPTTQWFRPELSEAQALLEERFRPNTVEIQEWDSAADRMLVSVSGPALAGADYVFTRTTRAALQFADRAPWLAPLTSPQMLGFAFTSPQGVAIAGMITVPRAPRVKPIPAIVLTPRVPWQSFEPVFRAEVHALADMGFAVIEYSGRGAWGRGRALRERLREGYEDAQVEDLLATVDYATRHFAIAEKRLAVAGLDHGGHVALRALELAPERFRCAVAINTPVDLRAWLGELEWGGASAAALLVSPAFGDDARQKEAPLVRDVDRITRPALMFNFRGPLGASATQAYTAARQFAAAVNRRVPETEIVDLSEDYMNGLPGARAEVFTRIEEFLNANVYSYTVKAGELQVDEPKAPAPEAATP